jgi:hypothetical protein
MYAATGVNDLRSRAMTSPLRYAPIALGASVVAAAADATVAFARVPQLAAGAVVAASFVFAGFFAARRAQNQTGEARALVVAGLLGALLYAALTLAWIVLGKRAPFASAAIAAVISFALGGVAFAAGVRIGSKRERNDESPGR